MSDLETFISAMDGEWVVVRHETEGVRIRVCLQSLSYPGVRWSYIPSIGQIVPTVGTKGRSAFLWTTQT